MTAVQVSRDEDLFGGVGCGPTSDRGLLAGLVICGHCWRRMDAHWVNERLGYRCRHGRTSAKSPADGQPKTLYRREDHLLTELTAHLEPRVAGLAGTELARHLRTNEIAIICHDVSCTMSSQAPDTRPPQGQLTLW